MFKLEVKKYSQNQWNTYMFAKIMFCDCTQKRGIFLIKKEENFRHKDKSNGKRFF